MFVGEMERFYIRTWSDYKKGILPNPGGGLNQPVKFYALMDNIEGVFNRIEEDERPKS